VSWVNHFRQSGTSNVPGLCDEMKPMKCSRKSPTCDLFVVGCRWLKNDDPLPTDLGEKYVVTGDGIRLTLKDIYFSDTGWFGYHFINQPYSIKEEDGK